MHSWRVLILPFIEEQKLYAEYDFSEPWNGPNNSKLASQRPRTYLLHGVDDPGGITTNYLAVVGANTAWPVDKKLTYKMLGSRTATTIHFVENVGSGISWMEPRDLNYDTMAMTLKDDPVNGISSWLQPPGVSMVDGSGKSLDMNLTEDELRAMLLRTGGDIVLPDGVNEMKDGRNRPLK